MSSALLDVQDLHVEFLGEEGVVNAVNGVSLTLDRGETLAVLGESGSGKSVTAAAIMDIIDSPPGFVRSGRILYDGRDLRTLASGERRRINGANIACVFQDALVALNPVYTIGWQIREVLIAHHAMSRGDAKREAVQLLDRVGIAAAASRANDYPHQLSGGQRQRVMIAMALALRPAIVIADEPTTALDVTVQAQIMDLLKEIQDEVGMGLLLITHDLGVVAQTADRVAVMYAGRIVESAPVRTIFKRPAHPYTKGLLGSIPRNDGINVDLIPIRGTPPDLARLPVGCPFHPRCDFVMDKCLTQTPPLRRIDTEHTVACHRDEESGDVR